MKNEYVLDKIHLEMFQFTTFFAYYCYKYIIYLYKYIVINIYYIYLFMNLSKLK